MLSFCRLKMVMRLVIYHYFLGQSCALAIRATMSSRFALISQVFSYNILILGMLGGGIYLLIFNASGLFSKWKGQSISWREACSSIRPCAKTSHLWEGGRWVPPRSTLGMLLSYSHYKYCFDWHGKGLYFWYCRYIQGCSLT